MRACALSNRLYVFVQIKEVKLDKLGIPYDNTVWFRMLNDLENEILDIE